MANENVMENGMYKPIANEQGKRECSGKRWSEEAREESGHMGI